MGKRRGPGSFIAPLETDQLHFISLLTGALIVTDRVEIVWK
jgi:hypothetical protein